MERATEELDLSAALAGGTDPQLINRLQHLWMECWLDATSSSQSFLLLSWPQFGAGEPLSNKLIDSISQPLILFLDIVNLV